MAVDDLGPRGRRLWEAHKDDVAGERGVVLLEEACRTADRLDRLDALLQGDADVWCHLVLNMMGDAYVIKIDPALSEARQQAAALRQLLTQLPLKESGDGDDPDDWLDGPGMST